MEKLKKGLLNEIDSILRQFDKNLNHLTIILTLNVPQISLDIFSLAEDSNILKNTSFRKI